MSPTVTLKLATSLDGKIALANGGSEWITSEKSREAGRRLRSAHDAIAVGANTAVIDNPQLTARIKGLPDPIRIIFDSHLRLLPQSNVVLSAKSTPTHVFCTAAAAQTPQAKILTDSGVVIVPIAAASRGLDIMAATAYLHRIGVSTLLLEGGGVLAASFLKAGLIHIIEWFRAPIILGADGRSGIGDLGLTDLNDAFGFSRVSVRESGVDLHERYERA